MPDNTVKVGRLNGIFFFIIGAIFLKLIYTWHMPISGIKAVIYTYHVLIFLVPY